MIKVLNMNDIFHCRILNPDLPAGFSSAPSHHSVSGGWSSSCTSGWKLVPGRHLALALLLKPFVFHPGSCAPSALMLPSTYIAMQAVKALGGLVPSPCVTCGHTARENKDLWPSTRVHWAEQHVLKLKSAPNKGGQPERQHNSQWSASTYWIVLKDSSSFKTDGTCSPSAVQPTAGFPFCVDPFVVRLLMNKSENSSLSEGFWARAKTEPEANVTHWPNCGIMKRNTFAYAFVTEEVTGRQIKSW